MMYFLTDFHDKQPNFLLFGSGFIGRGDPEADAIFTFGTVIVVLLIKQVYYLTGFIKRKGNYVKNA
ncbi:hypothetical protein E2R53_09840 [Peribacillus frigoritolerans]|nr:hypothetical protein E2R53_09840 [Peribacillus frigoritolerans]